MISSHGLAYGDKRTRTEFLRVHPEEGPTSIQLFGADPAIMREAAAMVADTGAKMIDLNMGCPVRKVCRTGAGAALLTDPQLAVDVARAAGEGSGLPVTVKMRPGIKPGERTGVEVARRLAAEGVVVGIGFHPRHASQQHKGLPDYELARSVVEELPVPVLLTGGLRTPEKALKAWKQTGAAAIMLARGSFGNPWIFQQVLGMREGPPELEEVVSEWGWVLDRAGESFGDDQRAARYLRKFHPWYLERFHEIDPETFTRARLTTINQDLQRTDSLDDARAVIGAIPLPAAA